MASRRQFIKSGLALSAVSLVGVPPRAHETHAPSLCIERFVFDSRFAAAVELARHAAHHRIPLAKTSGDLTDLWYHDFALAWKRAPMAVAGMTTRGGLFVLETLAADHRMFVVYWGVHTASPDGRVRHVLSGPASLIGRATADAGSPFWERLGRAISACPPSERRTTELRVTTAADDTPVGEETLFSWVIAPRAPRRTAA